MDQLGQLFSTHASSAWLIAALALAGLELLTGGFVMLWFACGALAAGLAAWLGAGFETQLVVLGVASLALFAGSRTLFRRFLMARAQRVQTNAPAMIGRTAEVVADVGPNLPGGSVKVNGEVWSARSVAGVLPAGSQALIVHREGLTLLVSEAEPR